MYSCPQISRVLIKLYFNLLNSLKKKINKTTDSFIFNMVLSWFIYYLIARNAAKPFILPNENRQVLKVVIYYTPKNPKTLQFQKNNSLKTWPTIKQSASKHFLK